MNILKNVTFSLGLFGVLAVASPAYANHVDFIADGAFTLFTTSTQGSASATQTGDGGNILGSEREVSLDFASGSGILSTGIIDAPEGPGPVGPNSDIVLLFDNSVNSSGLLTLEYDGEGDDGLGGVDFQTQWDSIAVQFADVQGAGDLTVEVEDTSDSVGSSTLSVADAGTFFFDFDDSGFSGVDFFNVDRVTLFLNTTIDASDFAISQITREARSEPIPEPASMLLGLVGLAGFAARKKKLNA